MKLIPYANIVVGSVMYLMICTRSDVAHAISVASRYMAKPGKEHWNVLKWILIWEVLWKLAYNLEVEIGEKMMRLWRASVTRTMQPTWTKETEWLYLYTIWHNSKLEIKSAVCGCSTYNWGWVHLTDRSCKGRKMTTKNSLRLWHLFRWSEDKLWYQLSHMLRKASNVPWKEQA